MIRSRRAELKQSQRTAAKEIGVAHPTLHAWENERRFPDVMVVSGLAEWLGVEIHEVEELREIPELDPDRT